MYAVKRVPFGTACVRITVGEYEISIAFDDSCGALQELSRGDIRVYLGEADVTEEISTGVIYATIEDLVMVYMWCKEH